MEYMPICIKDVGAGGVKTNKGMPNQCVSVVEYRVMKQEVIV